MTTVAPGRCIGSRCSRIGSSNCSRPTIGNRSISRMRIGPSGSTSSGCGSKEEMTSTVGGATVPAWRGSAPINQTLCSPGLTSHARDSASNHLHPVASGYTRWHWAGTGERLATNTRSHNFSPITMSFRNACPRTDSRPVTTSALLPSEASKLSFSVKLESSSAIPSRRARSPEAKSMNSVRRSRGVRSNRNVVPSWK